MCRGVPGGGVQVVDSSLVFPGHFVVVAKHRGDIVKLFSGDRLQSPGRLRVELRALGTEKASVCSLLDKRMAEAVSRLWSLIPLEKQPCLAEFVHRSSQLTWSFGYSFQRRKRELRPEN